MNQPQFSAILYYSLAKLDIPNKRAFRNPFPLSYNEFGIRQKENLEFFENLPDMLRALNQQKYWRCFAAISALEIEGNEY
jgi:hypothetical protein